MIIQEETRVMELQAQECQGLLATTRSQKEAETDFSPQILHREYGPANIWISDFQFPELSENKFLLFSVCGCLLWQPQEANLPQTRSILLL